MDGGEGRSKIIMCTNNRPKPSNCYIVIVNLNSKLIGKRDNWYEELY